MRGASISDLHLGFRAFSATIDGRNAREVDVERAFAEAVDQIVEAGVDVVTIAGDIVHHTRVSDFAKKAFLDGVRRLVAAGIRVIIIVGNHDVGRTADVLTPVMLAEGWSDRVHIVTTPKRIRFCLAPDAGAWEHPDECRAHVSVACYPFVALGDGADYRLEPDPDADVNVLLMHAAVKGDADGGALPYFYSGDQALDIGREVERWEVVAVGDYHEFTRLHPERLAFYSGSIERTSSNIWNESQPKGWVLWDTDAGAMEFREVATRHMSDYDLGDFDYPPGVGAEEVNEALQRLSGYTHIEGSILRFKVDAFPREERGQIDWALVREIKHRCLHFNLDIRNAKRATADLGDRREREGGRLTLADEARSFFADDPDDVQALAFEVLGVAAEAEDGGGADTDDDVEEAAA